MAFNFEGNTASSNVSEGNFGGRNYKKADAFIHLSLPRQDGANGKLGAIKLYLDREDLAALIKALNSGEVTIDQVKNALILDFRMATGNRSAFAVG